MRINLDITDLQKNSIRIKKSLPTLRFILKNSGKPIIIGHRGRPTKPDPTFSVKPVINILSQEIGATFDWVENLRFDPREQKNDISFAKELAARGDIYINDDFATCHHAAASLVAITTLLPSYAGLLLEEEIATLSRVRDNPQKPLVVIIGGIKIDDKLGVINRLQNTADYFLLGSAYNAIQEAMPSNAHVILPINTTKKSNQPFDINQKTIAEYEKIISRAKTIIWNGPVGAIENPAHQKGTKAIAEAIARSNAFSVVGGGNTLEFLTKLGMINQFSFVSTGGGAMLKFLAHQNLPGITALQ